MRTIYLKADNEDTLKKVVDTILKGGIIVFPTDNTYGLLANGNNKQAVEAIYQLKKRERRKPLGYLCNKKKADELCYISNEAKKVLAMWPEAISIILPKKECVPNYITSGFSSVLLVCPDTVSENLVEMCPEPIVCTSANLSSEPAIVDFETAKSIFDGKVALIVDGQESLRKANGTIIDFSQPQPTVLRSGPFPIEKLKSIIPNLVVAEKMI